MMTPCCASQATVARVLDLRSLKQLALNSINYSGMTEAEKRIALAAWQLQWDAWLKAMLAK